MGNENSGKQRDAEPPANSKPVESLRDRQSKALITLALSPKNMHRALIQRGISTEDAGRLVAAANGIPVEVDGERIEWTWQQVSKLVFLKHQFTTKLDISKDRFTIVNVAKPSVSQKTQPKHLDKETST